MVQFESLGADSYSPSIVTMALSCISSEIKPDIGRKSWFLPRDAIIYFIFYLHKRGYCRHAVSVCLSVRLSVRPSVTFVSCAKTNKDIFEIFSPSASQAILVFPYRTGWRYSDGNPLTGASNARGVRKNDDFRPISRSISETLIVRRGDMQRVNL